MENKTNALDDISKSTRNIQNPKNSKFYRAIIFNFLSKCLTSYLPLTVYFLINTPYLAGDNIIRPDEKVAFLNNLFLALSYVFISQVNSLSVKYDSIGNFIYSIKLFCGIVCIALFASKIILQFWMFYLMLVISGITLFFTHKDNIRDELEDMKR